MKNPRNIRKTTRYAEREIDIIKKKMKGMKMDYNTQFSEYTREKTLR